MVINNFKCTQCNAEYIGKTDRFLSIRISEHKKGENSAYFQHFENVQVIYAASTDKKFRVKEMYIS